MVPKLLLGPILENDALTRGLGDPEARLLVEWLVDWAEHLDQADPAPDTAAAIIRTLCRRARAVSRFVYLWCYANLRGAACQLAAAERCDWPLPSVKIDPYELMTTILNFEARVQHPQFTQDSD